jgi:hypothetical protein
MPPMNLNYISALVRLVARAEQERMPMARPLRCIGCLGPIGLSEHLCPACLKVARVGKCAVGPES